MKNRHSFPFILLAVALLFLQPQQGAAQVRDPEDFGRVETGLERMNLISGKDINNPENGAVSTHNFLVRRLITGENYSFVMRITNAGRVGIGYQLPYPPTSRLNVGMGAYKFSVDDTGSSRLRSNGVADFIAGGGACIGFNVARKQDASYSCEPGLLDANDPNSNRNGGALIWAELSGALNFTCLPSANGGNLDAPNLNFHYANAVQAYRVMKILPSMQVQIGLSAPPVNTTHNDYRLAVDGKLVAKSIFVTQLAANWPDFVFAPSYAQQSLPELEAYLKQNRHLPAVPSAAEVEKDGIDVASMNAKLLQSLEELTLHVIALGKQNAQLQAEVAALAAKVNPAAALAVSK